MKEKPDRIKVTSIKSKKANCGVCVCLLDKTPKGTPEDDVVSLCIGEWEKQGPKHQILLSFTEADEIGRALIATGFIDGFKNYDASYRGNAK